MADDGELLRGWRDGDETAGEELFSRHFPTLLRFFRNKAGSDCEELVQRTFMACLEKRDTLRDASSFRSFLFGIARLELLMHYRKKQKHGAEVAIEDASVCDLDPSPSRIVAKKQEERLLLEGLRRIPLDLQIVLELHYWERLTTHEVAEVMQIPVGTVRSRMRRARQMLESALAELPASDDLRRSTVAGLDDWAQGVRGLLGREA